MEDLRNFALSPGEAVALQKRLAPLVAESPLAAPPRTVAGFDLSIKGDQARAAAVVVDTRTLETVDEAVIDVTISFPYVPGLLSFREAPAVLTAYEALDSRPDLLMLDGQGRAHPRRFGIACHIGLILGVPAVGVAKSLLVGRGAEPGTNKGDTAPLIHWGQTVGMAVRTRAGVTPVYVSVGHLITLDEAVRLALGLSPRYRLPEPTRRAHTVAGRREG